VPVTVVIVDATDRIHGIKNRSLGQDLLQQETSLNLGHDHEVKDQTGDLGHVLGLLVLNYLL